MAFPIAVARHRPVGVKTGATPTGQWASRRLSASRVGRRTLRDPNRACNVRAVGSASHKISQEIATAGFSLRGVNFIEVYLAIDNRALGTIYDTQPVNVRLDRLVNGS
jgi:hypothetical protein